MYILPYNKDEIIPLITPHTSTSTIQLKGITNNNVRNDSKNGLVVRPITPLSPSAVSVFGSSSLRRLSDDGLSNSLLYFSKNMFQDGIVNGTSASNISQQSIDIHSPTRVTTPTVPTTNWLLNHNNQPFSPNKPLFSPPMSPAFNNNIGVNNQLNTIQEEVIKRWEIEKLRREQLERRNSELVREIRLMKSQIKSMSVLQSKSLEVN